MSCRGPFDDPIPLSPSNSSIPQASSLETSDSSPGFANRGYVPAVNRSVKLAHRALHNNNGQTAWLSQNDETAYSPAQPLIEEGLPPWLVMSESSYLIRRGK